MPFPLNTLQTCKTILLISFELSWTLLVVTARDWSSVWIHEWLIPSTTQQWMQGWTLQSTQYFWILWSSAEYTCMFPEKRSILEHIRLLYSYSFVDWWARRTYWNRSARWEQDQIHTLLTHVEARVLLPMMNDIQGQLFVKVCVHTWYIRVSADFSSFKSCNY